MKMLMASLGAHGQVAGKGKCIERCVVKQKHTNSLFFCVEVLRRRSSSCCHRCPFWGELKETETFTARTVFPRVGWWFYLVFVERKTETTFVTVVVVMVEYFSIYIYFIFHYKCLPALDGPDRYTCWKKGIRCGGFFREGYGNFYHCDRWCCTLVSFCSE